MTERELIAHRGLCDDAGGSRKPGSKKSRPFHGLVFEAELPPTDRNVVAWNVCKQ